MSPCTRVCRARTEWKDLTAPLRAVVSLPPPKCAQHLPAVGINPHSGKKGKRAHYWQSRKKKIEKKKKGAGGGGRILRTPKRRRPQRVHTGFAAVQRLPPAGPDGGAAAPTLAPRRISTQRQGHAGDAPSSPLGAPGAARSEGTACPRPPEGCPSLPPPHTTSAAARAVRSPLPPTSRRRWRGWDAGTTPQLAQGFPTSVCCWKLAGAGVWAAQGGRRCQCPFPGGPEGAASPQELGWGKAAEMMRKDRPEPRERRGGGRGWESLSPDTDPTPWVWDPPPRGWRGSPGEQRLLGGTQPGLNSPPLQGGQKYSFRLPPELKSCQKRPSEVTLLAGTC